MGNFLQILVQWMPVLIQLLNKDAQTRADAQPAMEAAVRAAVRAESWDGIIVSSIAVRCCQMDDAATAELLSGLETAYGAIQAMAAKET